MCWPPCTACRRSRRSTATGLPWPAGATAAGVSWRRGLSLADPGNVSLDPVIAAYLAYPYVGFLARNRMRPWRHCPRTLAVIARTDHLTSVRNAERVHDMVRNCGVEVETWIAEGTHSFDEPMNAPPMRHDPDLAAEAVRRFRALLEDVAVAPRT